MDLESFVGAAVLLLLVTAVAVAVFRRLGLGSVLGLLVAGILVGPHSVGSFITIDVEGIRSFTELGVVLLLFIIGLEMRPRRLWALRREVFGLGSLQILVSGAIIAVYIHLYQGSWNVAVLSGLALALSSTAFVVQILQERGELASRHGSAAFAVLLMQDLAVVPLLALVPILADTGTALEPGSPWQRIALAAGLLAVVWAAGSWLVPRALERLARDANRDAFFLVVMASVFLAAWASHKAGFSLAMGAFLMGMLLSGSRYNYQIQAHVEPYKGLLMSLFFVAVGMSIDLQALSQQPLLIAQHIVVIMTIKIAVLLLLALAFGLRRADAVRVAFFLAQSGEFGFVLFGAARAVGFIDDATFVIAVGVISATMLLTPLLVRSGDGLAARIGPAPRSAPDDVYRPDGTEARVRVIIAGYGRVGHTVATLLQASGIPYIAFDTNPANVAEGKADGRPVYYGDVADPELLAAAPFARADLMVLTVDDPRTALRAASLVRGAYPKLNVIARARDLPACDELIRAGATTALPEALEASLRLSAEALQAVGVAADEVDQVMTGLRSGHYALVRAEEKTAKSD